MRNLELVYCFLNKIFGLLKNIINIEKKEIRMNTSLSVARHLIGLARKENKGFTPMQLIKLVYLSHGWMLGLHGRPLIYDSVEAWQYGPVTPLLYKKIKHYRSNPVEVIECDVFNFDEIEKNIIEQVNEKYGHLSGITLSTITHEKNSPWDITRRLGDRVISNDLIMDYYQRVAKEYERR